MLDKQQTPIPEMTFQDQKGLAKTRKDLLRPERTCQDQKELAKTRKELPIPQKTCQNQKAQKRGGNVVGCVPGPLENCHLNVKKLSKKYIFSKKKAKNCLFFPKDFH